MNPEEKQQFNKLIQDFEKLKSDFYYNRFSGLEVKIKDIQFNEKVGFYGTFPTVQRTGAAQTAVATTGATDTSPFGYTSAAQANAIVALVNELRAALVAKGLIKGSA